MEPLFYLYLALQLSGVGVPFLLGKGWWPWGQRRHLPPQSAFRLAKRSVSVTCLSFQRPQEESGINLPTVVQALLLHS